MRMKHKIAIALSIAMISASLAEARVVRVRTGPRGRTHVTVTRGFPIHRALPTVVVRGPAVRVAPREYLAPVVFTAAVVASLPPAERRVWTSTERLDRGDGWTDLTFDVDRRGTQLLLDIDGGAAQINFAEVVFDNGDAQVVDFNERVHARGTYNLLDFKNGRKVDHVRMVAKADTADADIKLYLVQ
jgi:hypothetical protein